MLTEKDLTLYANNPKQHPEPQLKKLAEIVAEVGWRVSSLVNKKGVFVSGNGRWEMYNRFKDEFKLKPIWVIDTEGNTVMGGPETTPMTPEQETMFRIADNRVSELGFTDNALVLEEFEMLPDNLKELSGFSLGQLEGLDDTFNELTDTDSFEVNIRSKDKSEIDNFVEEIRGIVERYNVSMSVK